ncbi:MAG: hypothetical protein LBJ73_01815 [Rickettsiales bacterium]|jgi:hypothetical protein|nr:hypothetical protein [Rickettsiales bacterium]
MKFIRHNFLTNLNKYAPKGIEFVWLEEPAVDKNNRYDAYNIAIKMPNGKTQQMFSSGISLSSLDRFLSGLENLKAEKDIDKFMDEQFDNYLNGLIDENKRDQKKNSGFAYEPDRQDFIKNKAHMPMEYWGIYESKTVNIQKPPFEDMKKIQDALETNSETPDESYQKVKQFIRVAVMDAVKKMIQEQGLDGIKKTEELFKKAGNNLRSSGVSPFYKSGVVKANEIATRKIKEQNEK